MNTQLTLVAVGTIGADREIEIVCGSEFKTTWMPADTILTDAQMEAELEDLVETREDEAYWRSGGW